MEDWDLIIVGAGAAGLAAGVYGVRSGLKTLILEEKAAGGVTGVAPRVQNYLGFEDVLGSDLAAKMVSHAKAAGAVVRELDGVLSMDLKGDVKLLKTHRETYRGKAVIISTGSSYRELEIPGEKDFKGKGVSYCGLCDGPFFKNKKVVVVGGGNSALITALYMSGIASEVKLIHRRPDFRAEDALVKDVATKNNIKVIMNSELKEIRGDKIIKSIIIADLASGQTTEMSVDGVFVLVGESPNSLQAKQAGVSVEKDGCIIVDSHQRTNILGVFAAGDVTNGPVRQIGTAVGQGTIAAVEAYNFIRRPYYKR